MKLGFVDYRLDRSHATTFHRIIAEQHKNWELACVWEEMQEHADWAQSRGIRYTTKIEDVIETCDALMILYPDNIDQHLRVCRRVFPSLKPGKPVFIDKFLAPTVKEAKEIMAFARKHRIPIMSSSALFFAVELEEVLKNLQGTPEHCLVQGYGSLEIYGIHTVSLGVRIMGTGVVRIIETGDSALRAITCEYPNGRRLVFNLMTDPQSHSVMPWRFVIRAGAAFHSDVVKDSAGFYANLLRNVMRFLETGHPPIPIEANLECIRILEAAKRSLALGNRWVRAARGK